MNPLTKKKLTLSLRVAWHGSVLIGSLIYVNLGAVLLPSRQSSDRDLALHLVATAFICGLSVTDRLNSIRHLLDEIHAFVNRPRNNNH